MKPSSLGAGIVRSACRDLKIQRALKACPTINTSDSGVSNEPQATRLEGFIQVASAAYVAWLTLATVVNVSCVLVFCRWDGWGLSDATWTVTMMVIAMVLGLLEVRVWRNVALGGVFTWAFAGIALRAGQPLEVVVVAALIAVVFLVALVSAFRRPAVASRGERS